MAVCGAASIRCFMARLLGKHDGYVLAGFLDAAVSAVSPPACHAEIHTRVSGSAVIPQVGLSLPILVRRSVPTVTFLTFLPSVMSYGFTAGIGRFSVTGRAALTPGFTISSGPDGFGVTGFSFY